MSPQGQTAEGRPGPCWRLQSRARGCRRHFLPDTQFVLQPLPGEVGPGPAVGVTGTGTRSQSSAAAPAHPLQLSRPSTSLPGPTATARPVPAAEPGWGCSSRRSRRCQTPVCSLRCRTGKRLERQERKGGKDRTDQQVEQCPNSNICLAVQRVRAPVSPGPPGPCRPSCASHYSPAPSPRPFPLCIFSFPVPLFLSIIVLCWLSLLSLFSKPLSLFVIRPFVVAPISCSLCLFFSVSLCPSAHRSFFLLCLFVLIYSPLCLSQSVWPVPCSLSLSAWYVSPPVLYFPSFRPSVLPSLLFTLTVFLRSASHHPCSSSCSSPLSLSPKAAP